MNINKNTPRFYRKKKVDGKKRAFPVEPGEQGFLARIFLRQKDKIKKEGK